MESDHGAGNFVGIKMTDDTVEHSGSFIKATQSLPEPEVQKKMIEDIFSEDLVNGGVYYLINAKWWEMWVHYVGFQNRPPGSIEPLPINNEPLFEDIRTGILVRHLQEGRHFEFLAADVWNMLTSWYGYDKEIKRTASKDSKDRVIIQVYPTVLKVVRSSDEDDVREIKIFTKRCTVRDFIRLMCMKFGLEPDNVRVWDYYNKRRVAMLKNHKKFLSECNLMEGQLMLLEERGEDGEFPYNASASMDYSYSSNAEPTEPGKTGLANLGNTCFMNSALQCLSATVPLTDFFLTRGYLEDLNRENPLGTGGRAADDYGGLLRDLWSPETSVAEPRQFKKTIEKVAPQFGGYQQHDSQELLSFLLDGLHEDLNRIKDKPYIESEERDLPDAELSRIAWDEHIRRNDSIIVDHFQALLKSKLVCPDCSKISIKFDPFMYLTLPLPVETKRKLHVTVCFLNTDRQPTRFCVKVEKSGNVEDIMKELSTLTEIPLERLILTEIWNKKFYKILPNRSWLADINDKDELVAYELLGEPDTVNLKVLMVRISELGSASPFGYPFILSIKKSITPKDLYAELIRRVKPLLKDDEEIPEFTQRLVEIEMRKDDDDDDDDDDDEDSDDKDSDEEEEAPRKQIVYRNTTIAEFSNGKRNLFNAPMDEPIVFENDTNNYYFAFDKDHYVQYYDKENKDKFIVDDESVETIGNEVRKKLASIDIYECLNLFTVEEVLGASDTWYCNRCKDHKQATKKFDLWNLPPILVIHLKRFSYQSKFSKDKIDMKVNFPLEGLDLSRFVLDKTDQEYVYDLYAVSNHYGVLSSGHYTAFARHRNDGQWYHYDDRSVSPVSDPSSICSSAAYVLFYKRRDVDWPEFVYTSPPPLEPEPEPEEITGLLAEDD